MAVPDTNTFGLTDVKAEVNTFATGLVDCITASDETKFDLNYGGKVANSLYSFRNYGASRSILLSAGFTLSATACGATPTVTYYTVFSTLVTIGTKIYTDLALTLALDGENKYYKYLGGTIQIDADGFVTSVNSCSTSITLGTGQTTGALACATSPSVGYFIPIGNTVQVGTYVYTDSDLTTVLVGGSNYYKYGTNQVIVVTNAGLISSVLNCSSALTISLNSYESGVDACADPFTSTQTVYYGLDGYFDGETLYTDSGLTTPFDGLRDYWKTSVATSIRVDENGLVSLTALCL